MTFAVTPSYVVHLAAWVFAFGTIAFAVEQWFNRRFRTAVCFPEFQITLLRWSVALGIVDVFVFLVLLFLGELSGVRLDPESQRVLLLVVSFPIVVHFLAIDLPTGKHAPGSDRYHQAMRLYSRILTRSEGRLEDTRRDCLREYLQRFLRREPTREDVVGIVQSALFYYSMQKPPKEHVNAGFMESLVSIYDQWLATDSAELVEFIYFTILDEHGPRFLTGSRSFAR